MGRLISYLSSSANKKNIINLSDENNACGSSAAPNAATTFEAMLHRLLETSELLGTSMHQICVMALFFKNAGIKLFISKIYFLLRVAVAG